MMQDFGSNLNFPLPFRLYTRLSVLVQYFSLTSLFNIFPEGVLGSESTNATDLDALNLAILFLQKSISSSDVALAPSFHMTSA